MTTQKETITWHKYPEEKPTVNGRYIICAKNCDAPIVAWWVWFDFYNYGDLNSAKYAEVIAWAELPKGWQKVNKNDNLQK